ATRAARAPPRSRAVWQRLPEPALRLGSRASPARAASDQSRRARVDLRPHGSRAVWAKARARAPITPENPKNILGCARNRRVGPCRMFDDVSSPAPKVPLDSSAEEAVQRLGRWMRVVGTIQLGFTGFALLV